MERLLNILTNPDKRHFWILNRKYCPLKEMSDGKAEVLYSYDPVAQETPFSLEAIMNLESYNYKTFIQAYKEERKEMLDDDVQDMRILAVWSFYKNVHKDDVMLFVHGNEIEGYYGPDAKEWYFTITNGDENHRLNVGIAVLAPGETSPEFTLGNGGITKVRYWWHLTNGESEAAFIDIDMHNLPSGTKKNYVMKYN